MTRALVIGKFMPVHVGHVALIEYACAYGDEVVVSMSYTPSDPIPGNVRFNWVQQVVAGIPKATAFMVCDDFDDESLPIDQRVAIWAAFIKRTYPPIHVVVSSEIYGEPFARHLGAQHISFDPERRRFPVSATMIRREPMRFWEYIAAPARPWFVKKICLFGAESTGKSTLTQRLAARYNTVFVPEVAREMLATNDFTVDDIIAIGHAHHARIQEKVREANRLLFCDTDAITTQIYSKHYLGVIPEVLYHLEQQTLYDLYFLLEVDVPWVADGLRDLGDRREEMSQLFRQALIDRNIPYVVVNGDFEQREKMMVEAIDKVVLRIGS